MAHGPEGPPIPKEGPTPATREYAPTAKGPGLPSEDADARLDYTLWLPLGKFFEPDPDPTAEHPAETAEIEGYFVAPGQTLTIALSAAGPAAVDLLDSIWATLQHKGLGVRHITVLNDRGRLVSIMTLRLDVSAQDLRTLRTLVIVPIRSRQGLAEVHLLATREEVSELEGKIAGTSPPAAHPYVATLPPARQTGPVQPEDWALLGLLSAVGAFDGPNGPSPSLVADALGVDPASFVERARSVEQRLDGLVTGLFADMPATPGWAVSATGAE